MALGAAYLKGGWVVRIYDTTGKLVDLPQSDLESVELFDAINGGSGKCTLTYKRDFNNIGAIANGYSVLVWIWGPGQTMPTDPYYGGHIVDFDQEQQTASGQVVVYVEGDAVLSDADIVTEAINPGISGNPNLDAAVYLAHLDSVYRPPNFIAASIPGTMFNLFPASFDGTPLGQCFDTITKQTRGDGSGGGSTGNLWTWFVRTKHDLTRQIVVQPDQNPNYIGTLAFKHLFVGSMVDQYKIQNVYRNIKNVVAIYGGKDPVTGNQIYGAYDDPASVAQYTAIETKINVPFIVTQDGLQSYAKTWLTLNAYPQAQGTMRMLYPDYSILSGTWVQCWEYPGSGVSGPVIKQVRVGQVRVLIQGERIQQFLYTNSPVPYLDEAVYRMGLHVSTSQSIANSGLQVNKQTLYVRSGGTVTATGSSGGNAEVAIAATTAVFPSGQVIAAAMPLTSLVDNSGGVNNGQGGNGAFTVSLNSSGSYIITKGAPRPANISTQQNLCAIVVSGGTIIAGGVTDVRILNASPAMSPGTTPSIASGAATLSYPNGTGGPTFDAQVVVNLGSSASSSDAALLDLELWVAAHGASNAVPQYWGSVQPNASGSYTLLYAQLAAGTQWDLYVAFRDGAGLLGGQNVAAPTNCLLLATTAANAQQLTEFSGGVTSPVDGSWSNVDGVSSSAQYPLATGQPFQAAATIAKQSATADAGVIVGTEQSGYGVLHDSSGVVNVVRYNQGFGLRMSASIGPTSDTDDHSYRLTATPATNNQLEASVDNVTVTTSDTGTSTAVLTRPFPRNTSLGRDGTVTAAADGSIAAPVTFSPSFTRSVSAVRFGLSNYTGSDNPRLYVRIVGNATTSGLSAMVSGGQPGSSVTLHFQAMGDF